MLPIFHLSAPDFVRVLRSSSFENQLPSFPPALPLSLPLFPLSQPPTPLPLSTNIYFSGFSSEHREEECRARRLVLPFPVWPPPATFSTRVLFVTWVTVISPSPVIYRLYLGLPPFQDPMQDPSFHLVLTPP